MSLLDVRPPGLNVAYRPGDPLTVVLTWPAGTLSGRTFTASLGTASLGVSILGDVMTVTASPAQTAAAADAEVWELVDTTAADDFTVMVGRWVPSDKGTSHHAATVTVTNGSGDVDVTLQGMSSVGALTIAGDLTIGGDVTVNGQPLSFLVADDPAEVDLTTVGDVTTLTLTDLVARSAMKHASGQYYFSHYTSVTASTLTDGQLILCPVWLSAGTIDRIGCDVSTQQAASAIRLGIYTDDVGLPANLIAEATTTADSTTLGVKDLTISAVIPVNGRYWMAAVCQGSSAVAVNAPGNIGNNPVPLPLGTTAIGGTTSLFSRIKASVAGALPATITGLNANPQGARFRWHFRYA